MQIHIELILRRRVVFPVNLCVAGKTGFNLVAQIELGQLGGITDE